jgi:pimeloyl-ACP methyl ester carboxylesterase
VKAIQQKLLIVCSWGLVIVILAACGSTTPVVETVENTMAVEVTQEVEVIVPATLTPEVPTTTPVPSITSTPKPMVDYTTEAVAFTTEDEIDLEGNLYLSEGDIAVVFAHMAGENDQQNWIPFAEYIAPRGFSSLTFNFRCYGASGCGGSGSSAILLIYDLGAAIDFLHEQGFEKVVCMGASMGGRGCINVAFDKELAGFVILAGTGSGDPDRQNLEDIINPEMPKLFIVAENDPTLDRVLAMNRLYESAPEPKIFKTYPGTAHGTELFNSYGRELRNTLLDFLEGIH